MNQFGKYVSLKHTYCYQMSAQVFEFPLCFATIIFHTSLSKNIEFHVMTNDMLHRKRIMFFFENNGTISPSNSSLEIV